MVSTGWLIRRLSAADVLDYRAIRLATLELEPDFFGSLHSSEVERPVEDFAKVIAGASVLGAYADDQIIGVVRLHAEAGAKERHKASLHGFFVLPEHRGKGVGRQLMQSAIELAQASFEQLTLSVVEGNDQAIGMYEQFGFKRYGQEPRARKFNGIYTDIVLMTLQLS